MTVIAEVPADQAEPVLRLPSLPDAPPPNGFPVLMTVAPVVVALILFALLRTPYVLMFAILGPVLGIANVIDQRIGRKRRRRRDEARFEDDALTVEMEIRHAHERLRARKRAEHPLAHDLVMGARRIEPGIVVGVTTVGSGLRTEGAGTDERSRELARRAGRLEGVPLTTDCERLVVTGSRADVAGTVRALVVQLLSDRKDAGLALCGDQLQNVAFELLSAGVELVAPADAEVRICAHEWLNSAGGGCSPPASYAHISIEPGGESVLTDTAGRKTRMRADSLGASMLGRWLPTILAAQRERARSARRLPDHCYLGDLADGPEGRLTASFLLGEAHTPAIDLVDHGPHAVIGGTTGSGKSELLIAWTAALARNHSSNECNFLCIDFKGGATFDSVASLPHCVGIVTDLDDDEALRVLASLRAEVRRRELALRELGARDISELEPGVVPRLVVLVDEFQALIEAHPDLQDVFGDLGARGRSLGIHLILCTQRPTGAFRESLLANAAIRICLRVEQTSDSMTLLGTAQGAQLSRDIRGRALLKIGNGDAQEVQVAIAQPALIAELAAREVALRRSAQQERVRSPWHPRLPDSFALRALAHEGTARGVPFALGDLPEKQQQPVISIDRPGQHLFVVGMSESGKSGVTHAIGESARTRGVRVTRICGGVEGAWDSVEELLRQRRDSWTIVLLDDLDLLEQQFDDEHRAEWLVRLQRLLRTGSRMNISVVLTARRISGSLQKLRGICNDTLYLAAPSRQEWILQGGDPADWSDQVIPGRGRLGRLLIQVAASSAAMELEAQTSWHPFTVPHSGLVVVGRRLGPVREGLSGLGHQSAPVPNAASLRGGELAWEEKVFVGEIEQWNASYGTLPNLAERIPVLAVGLTAGEWRSTFRGDPIYPALEDPFSRALLRMPDGRVSRVLLDRGRPMQVEGISR